MRHKLVNQRTGNEIEQIKSFRYVEEVNVTENIRFGACVAAMIEVQFYRIREPNTYETFDNPVQNGDIIEYYQVDEEENETKIGVFTAMVDTPQRSIVSFVAYDNISKLDVDFSARLKSLADNGRFPMTVTALVQIAASVAGVTQYITDTSYLPSDLYDSSFLGANIKAFYADTITVRDVFSQLAEILSCYVRCDENGNIIPDTYNFDYVDGTSTQYLISPTDRVSAYVASQYTPIYYKENGLNYANYQADRPSETYVYNSNGEPISWSDAVDRIWPDGKIYIVSSNIFVDNAETPNDFRFTANNIMERLEKFKYRDAVTVDREEEVDPETGDIIIVETVQNVHRTYKPSIVKLFPFNNPFRAGDVYWFSYNPYDLNPTRFRGVVTKLEITDEVATLTGTGQQVYESAKQNFEDQNQRTVSIESRLNSNESNINGKVSKSGDTMTGDLNVDRKEATNGAGRLRLIGNRKAKAGTDDAGTSNRPFGGIYIYDGSTDGNGPNDEYNVFYNECTLHANDNRVYTSYVVRRLLANGTAANNGFYIGVNTDGSSHVSFAGGGKKAWLAALLEPVTITPTIPSALPTGVTAIGYVHVTQSGYVVQVNGNITRNTTDNGSAWANIASGLPKPLLQNSTALYNLFSSTGLWSSSVRPLYLRVTASGKLDFAYGQAASSTASYRFCFTYIAEELY